MGARSPWRAASRRQVSDSSSCAVMDCFPTEACRPEGTGLRYAPCAGQPQHFFKHSFQFHAEAAHDLAPLFDFQALIAPRAGGRTADGHLAWLREPFANGG